MHICLYRKERDNEYNETTTSNVSPKCEKDKDLLWLLSVKPMIHAKFTCYTGKKSQLRMSFNQLYIYFSSKNSDNKLKSLKSWYLKLFFFSKPLRKDQSITIY